MMRRKKEAGKQTGQTDGQLQRVGTVQSSRVVCSYVGSSERGCTGEAGGQVGLEMDFPSPPFELCRPPTLFLPVLLSLSRCLVLVSIQEQARPRWWRLELALQPSARWAGGW